MSASRQYEGVKMFVEVADIFWASVALVMLNVLVFTTAFRNWKLTEDRDYWRRQYHALKDYMVK
jgi:hypothetical protein